MRWTPLSRQKMDFFKVEKYTSGTGLLGVRAWAVGTGTRDRVGTGFCTREPGEDARSCRIGSSLRCSSVPPCTVAYSFEIDLLVFDRAPKTFHKDVVEDPSSAVHADLDSCCFQHPGESAGGELGALVGIEDLRPSSFKGIRERFDAEVDLHRYGNGPGNDVTAEPVHDGNKVDETLLSSEYTLCQPPIPDPDDRSLRP